MRPNITTRSTRTTRTTLATITLVGAAALTGCVADADDARTGVDGDTAAVLTEAADEPYARAALAALTREAEAPAPSNLMSVDGILDTCLFAAGPINEFAECIFDLDSRTITYCAPQLAGQVQLAASQPAQGMVVDVDLAGWDAALVAAVADSVSDYAFHLGNDPTNNGWAGGSSTYDSEAHLFNNALYVYRNDLGSSTQAAVLSNAIPGGSGAFCATVRDGHLKWLREDATSPTNTSSMDVMDPYIFRVDPAQGANDSKFYVGFEHVVQAGAHRAGADLQPEVRVLLVR